VDLHQLAGVIVDFLPEANRVFVGVYFLQVAGSPSVVARYVQPIAASSVARFPPLTELPFILFPAAHGGTLRDGTVVHQRPCSPRRHHDDRHHTRHNLRHASLPGDRLPLLPPPSSLGEGRRGEGSLEDPREPDLSHSPITQPHGESLGVAFGLRRSGTEAPHLHLSSAWIDDPVFPHSLALVKVALDVRSRRAVLGLRISITRSGAPRIPSSVRTLRRSFDTNSRSGCTPSSVSENSTPTGA